jgi:mono/diheme cytochrome c family protein
MKTLRRLAIALGSLVALAGITLAVLLAVAAHRIDRIWDLDAPAVVADRAPAAVARGAVLFRSECMGCHAPPGSAPTSAPILGPTAAASS